VPQPLVLAIEPDLRQAAIVKRIVREQVLADVAVVDSREAALEAMRTTIPDVLLLSALMSPRDEDELIAHLRTLENADHLQTHTIPQLASTLNPIESRMPRGLLSAFRRKKEPEVAPSGCDPDLFAEEIRVFLQQAAEKKRERAAAAGAPPADTAWRAGPPAKTAGPVTTDAAPETEETASSSWSSPFEWKPSTASSPMADPEHSIAPADTSLTSVESLMSHLRPPSGITTVADLSVSDHDQAEESAFSTAPLDIADPEPAPVEAAAPFLAETAETPVPESQPTVEAQAATIEDRGPRTEDRGSRTEDRGPRTEDRGSKIEDRGSKIKDSGSKIEDSGLRIRDQRLGIRDRVPARLGALASWARSEDRARDTAQESDDLRGLLTGLAVPPAVVSVGYGRGCRIRRVRVLAGRERHEAESVGAVIISKRVLAEQRDLRDQQQA
jgi:CheY-like chemotaxis protein